jgi:hypothetical protein
MAAMAADMTYLCSLPNPGTDGHPKILVSNDPALIARWIEAENREGRGVYYTPNPLKPGANRHGRDNIGAILVVFVDVDCKHLRETPEEVEQNLRNLLLPPTWIVNSGHGYHVGWELKEPVAHDDPGFAGVCELQAALIQYLGGDPQVRPWSLLRLPGTLNTKHTPHVPCVEIHRGDTVDLTEVSDFVELTSNNELLTRKAEEADERSNGADSAGAHKGPIDVDARLAAMRWQGAGAAAINVTQTQCVGSLLAHGIGLEETVRTVLEATRACVSADPKAKNWDWLEEEKAIWQSGLNLIVKDPDRLSSLVPDYMRETFDAAITSHKKPTACFRKDAGWHIRGYTPVLIAGTDVLMAGAGVAPAPDRTPRVPKIAAAPFKPFDPAQLPAREWLYGGHYQRGIITATIGSGGGGKSSLDLVELLSMATCRDLLGEQPLERCRVWYHNAEDTVDEIYRRIAAICQHYSIPQTELEGWLFVTSGIEMPIRIATSHGGKVTVDAMTVADIIRTITENEISVASFDPLIAHHTGVENATSDMDQVCREFARIANATDCAIEIVHHTRKPAFGQEELSVTDSRGAGAIKDAVRSMRVLNTMSKGEADKIGIDDVDRRLHFRIDSGKANMAPPSAARWRKFEGIDLPNGDNVGVVTRWTYPTETVAEVPDAVCTQIQTEVGKTEYRAAAQSHQWVGKLVARVFRLDPTTKAGKAAVGRQLAALYNKGVITVADGTTGRHKVNAVTAGPWRPGIHA